MILTKENLDTKWSEIFRYFKEPKAAIAEVLLLFSEESDDEYEWSEQDIYEQMRRITRKCE